MTPFQFAKMLSKAPTRIILQWIAVSLAFTVLFGVVYALLRKFLFFPDIAFIKEPLLDSMILGFAGSLHFISRTILNLSVVLLIVKAIFFIFNKHTSFYSNMNLDKR